MLSIDQKNTLYNAILKTYTVEETVFEVNCIYNNQIISGRVVDPSIEHDEGTTGYPIIIISYIPGGELMGDLESGVSWRFIMLSVDIYAKNFDDRPSGEIINGQMLNDELSRQFINDVNDNWNTDPALLRENVRLDTSVEDPLDLSNIIGSSHVYRNHIDILDGSAEKSVELVVESVFGTFPTDPTMLGIGGYPVKVTNKKTVQIENFPYLKEVAGTNRSQSTKVAKVGEAYSTNIEMRPTGWDMWAYLLGGVVATPAISDTIANLSIGNKVGAAEYEKFSGGIVQKIECNIEPDKAATQTVDILFVESDGITGADYVGAGAHAAVASGAPLDAPGITSVLYDAAALSTVDAKLEYIKMGVEVREIFHWN